MINTTTITTPTLGLAAIYLRTAVANSPRHYAVPGLGHFAVPDGLQDPHQRVQGDLPCRARRRYVVGSHMSRSWLSLMTCRVRPNPWIFGPSDGLLLHPQPPRRIELPGLDPFLVHARCEPIHEGLQRVQRGRQI